MAVQLLLAFEIESEISIIYGSKIWISYVWDEFNKSWDENLTL